MTVEVMYRTALADMRRNASLVLLYVGVHVLMALILGGISHAVLGAPEPDEGPAWGWVFRLAEQVVSVLIISLLQTLVFVRMGADIDRPLWKYRDDKDALERFFALWLVFNLLFMTLMQLISTAASNDATDAAGALYIIWILYQVLGFPVTVCLMYAGRLASPEASEALSPISRQAGLFAAATLPMFRALAWHFAGLSNVERVQPGLQLLLFEALWIFPGALIEVFVFASVWRVCMHHRNTAFHEDGDFFDF